MGIKEGITAKKVLKIIIICVVVGFFLFVFALFQTCKTKSTSISKRDPFKEVIGKELIIKRPVRLFMPKDPDKTDYPYAISDTNQVSWESYMSGLQANEPEIKLSDSIKENAKVVFDKAVIYTNGVSGFSRPKLFGTLTSTEGNTYKVEFCWGKYESGYPWKGSHQPYKFSIAPWQEVQDTAHYYLPSAQWW